MTTVYDDVRLCKKIITRAIASLSNVCSEMKNSRKKISKLFPLLSQNFFTELLV